MRFWGIQSDFDFVDAGGESYRRLAYHMENYRNMAQVIEVKMRQDADSRDAAHSRLLRADVTIPPKLMGTYSGKPRSFARVIGDLRMKVEERRSKSHAARKNAMARLDEIHRLIKALKKRKKSSSEASIFHQHLLTNG